VEGDLYKIPVIEAKQVEFSQEHWASHRRGKRTREEILSLIISNPNLSSQEISEKVGKCDRQIRRQLSQLMIEGQVRKEGKGYFSA
jgi:predicted ArsR family transcriptional regulator